MSGNEILLGSLFDGVGAFPYAASFFGIKTIWASEILPNAISVTRRHFPEMEHLGDVTKLDGGKLPPVHIIAFGSPCQSFSVAGDRSAFSGKSGLFFEAIRIIREMRAATNGKYPEVICFENVVGLLHVDSRRSYKTVLEAFCEAEIPMPQSGRWANAGMVRGRGIDLAWVIKDAQYYRTAQRRKRLFLVVDFTERQCASKVLFIEKSLSGYFAAREREGQGAPPAAESGAGGTGGSECKNAGFNGFRSVTGSIEYAEEHAPCLCASMPPNVAVFMAGQAKNARSIAYSETIAPTLKGSPSGLNQVPCVCEPHSSGIDFPCVYGICSHNSNSMKSANPFSGIYRADTCRTLDQNCGNPSCQQGGMVVVEPQLARTLTARGDSSPCADRGQNVVAVPIAFAQNQRCEVRNLGGIAGCLAARHGVKQQTYVAQPADRHAADVHPTITGTLCGSGAGLSRPAGMASETDLCVAFPDFLSYIVRRLTPLEAERLMSLPDFWTAYGHDGKIMSDSARYSMCGNSIVVNCLAYIMQNIASFFS